MATLRSFADAPDRRTATVLLGAAVFDFDAAFLCAGFFAAEETSAWTAGTTKTNAHNDATIRSADLIICTPPLVLASGNYILQSSKIVKISKGMKQLAHRIKQLS
ncbi:hypothetical protein [Noviherbaspirillum sp.]|uniref:hypothetical protein n=1 Tax=Noviherbaspirillum sp. TaxID=1926288 RepID=UPI002DDCA6DD|nr:hypothetical protein [Noviherbaspirillum sp.]